MCTSGLMASATKKDLLRYRYYTTEMLFTKYFPEYTKKVRFGAPSLIAAIVDLRIASLGYRPFAFQYAGLDCEDASNGVEGHTI